MIATLKQSFLTLNKVVLLMGLGLVMLSCSPASVDLHRDRSPALSLEEFFEGNTVAYGIYENRYGNMERQFRVNIIGTVNGDTLILDEQFLYDDGERSSRVWTITNQGKKPGGLQMQSAGHFPKGVGAFGASVEDLVVLAKSAVRYAR